MASATASTALRARRSSPSGFSVAQADEGLSKTSGDAGDRLRAALAVLGAAR